MPGHFDNNEKFNGSKICASVHTMPGHFDKSTKFDGNELSVRCLRQRNVPKHRESISFVPKALNNVLSSLFSSVHTMPFSKCAD